MPDGSTVSAIRDTLESRGVLHELRGRVRAEVFSALDVERQSLPPLSHENLIINELIREYLVFNRYRHTASVLTAGELKRRRGHWRNIGRWSSIEGGLI